MNKIIALLASSLFTVFGGFSWTAPPWFLSADSYRKRRPGIFYLVTAVILCAVIGAAGGYLYLKNRPKPDLVVAKASLSEIQPPADEKRPPEPLTITFAKESAKESPISAARIDLAGKKISSGIQISPPLDGVWEWDGDKAIKFSPKTPWPAAVKYNVAISAEILEKAVRLKEREVGFETAPFKAAFETGPGFHTDPRDRSVHQATATVTFSHVVDEKSIRDGLLLSIASKDGKDVQKNFGITVDKGGRRVHVVSDLIEIEAEEQFATLLLTKKIKTVQGGAALLEELRGKLKIPSVSTFFNLSEIRATIIPNLKKEPEQTVTIAFSDSIPRNRLEGKVKAWVLVKKNINNSYEHWTSPSQVTAALLERSTPLSVTVSEILGESSDRFGLVFDAPESRDLYVRFEAGLQSDSGYELAKPYDAVMLVPPYPKEVRLVGEGGFMAATGNRTVSIQARGLKAVKIKIRRLLPKQLHHLVTQTGGDITNPYFHNSYIFNETNISEGFEKVVHLAPKDAKTPVYASLDFSEYVDPQGIKPSVFFIEAMGWDPATDTQVTGASDYAEGGDYGYDGSYTPSWVAKRTIVVTDLAILIKNGADRSRDVFVQSVADGSPAAGAEVEIVARNGEALQSGMTGADGHVAFPALGEATDPGREPVFCMVKRQADVSFLPFDREQRQLEMSKFDVGGINTGLLDKNQLSAFAFSDRGIYRPGETVNLGFLVRGKGFAVPAGIPLELHISGPQTVLLKKKLSIPESGFFELNFPTTPSSATGEHHAELFLVKERGYLDRMIGSIMFKVEEFEPDRMRMTSVLSESAAGWLLPENLDATVTLKNLFGAPAQNRKVTGKLILEPTGFSFEKYPGYVFTDPLTVSDKPLKAVIEEISEHRTDPNGQAVIPLDLGRFEKGTYRLTLSLEGFDEGGGRGVKAFNTALVSPMKTIAGYKADGDLYFIKQGGARKIRFIAVNRQLEAEGLEKLSLRKIRIISISALVKQPNGTYAYQSARKEEVVWEKPFDLPVEGREIALETEAAGDWALELRDESGTRISRVSYTVAGESNITAEIEKTAELGIKLARPNIKAGEEIELQVTTPYRGAGLITIETDRVHTFGWFKAGTLTSIQKIRVPEYLEGNAYVSVALVRSLDDPEIFTSPLSYAAVSFNIDRSRRELPPELTVPEKVIPGTRMEIGYKATRPCKMVLFAVDEGILQFAGYKTPAPLDHFFQKLALEVQTLQTADLILPEYQLLLQRMGTGGDASAEALRAKHLNPFARKNNRPAVFWSGIIDAGPEPRTVSWETPDTFSGEVRVMAVAVDKDGMGASEKRVIVRGPFVVSPVMPLAVTPGDTFTLTAGVANVQEGSGKAFPVTLRIEADKGLAIQGSTEQQLTIDEGSESVAVFTVKAVGPPGSAAIRFIASAGELKGTTSAALSIRPPVPDMTTIRSGIADAGKVEIRIDRRIIPEFAKQRVSASASPLVLATALETWLNEFPYGCTEQLLSRGFPALVYASYPGKSYSSEKAAEKVKAAISMLRERQNQDGGAAMWPGGPTDDFVSLYANHFLIDASQAGFQVPRDMLDRAGDYLRRKAGEWSGSNNPGMRAYCIYLLTRTGQVTSNYLIDLEKDLGKEKEWRAGITASFMAASYRLMKQDNLASGLHGKFKPGDREGADGLFLGSGAADAIDIYLTARHFPEKLDRISGERIMKGLIDPVLSGDFHTFEAAWTVMALGSWTGNEPADSITISGITDQGKDNRLQMMSDPFPTALFGTEIDGLDIQGGRRLFYTVTQSGFDREMPKTELRGGLEILREFRPAAGKEDKPIRPGDDITAVLKVRALDGRHLDNVALVDMFAGCFSPDIQSVRANNIRNVFSYIDVREDRAVFYGSFGPDIREISYKLRVTAGGEFIVPPAYGEALYDTRVKARSLPRTIKVEAQ